MVLPQYRRSAAGSLERRPLEISSQLPAVQRHLADQALPDMNSSSRCRPAGRGSQSQLMEPRLAILISMSTHRPEGYSVLDVAVHLKAVTSTCHPVAPGGFKFMDGPPTLTLSYRYQLPHNVPSTIRSGWPERYSTTDVPVSWRMGIDVRGLEPAVPSQQPSGVSSTVTYRLERR
jgi:hypothetical protein